MANTHCPLKLATSAISLILLHGSWLNKIKHMKCVEYWSWMRSKVNLTIWMRFKESVGHFSGTDEIEIVLISTGRRNRSNVFYE